MKSIILILCALFFLTPAPTRAEIVKTSVPCEGNNCLYWWPKAPSPPGWHRDPEASDARGINAQIPDGSTFENSATVIYAKAIYKPLVPTITSLAILIGEDKKDFLSRDPKMSIGEPETLTTGDGTVLRSFTFSPGGDGSWEEVSYGEKDNFFLIFTVSSRTKAGLAGAREAYRRFIENYRDKP